MIQVWKDFSRPQVRLWLRAGSALRIEQVAKALSSQVLKTSEEGGQSASLGNLLQSLAVFMVKQIFL